MSYGAERWARSLCLDFKGHDTAFDVLKEIAFWFRDDQMVCDAVTQGEITKLIAKKKADTVGDAVRYLESTGLVKAKKLVDPSSGHVKGTHFYLPKYVPSEWPVDRQGVDLFLRRGQYGVAKAGGSAVGRTPSKRGIPLNGVSQQVGGGIPLNGAGYPAERDGGIPSNGKQIQGITGNNREYRE